MADRYLLKARKGKRGIWRRRYASRVMGHPRLSPVNWKGQPNRKFFTRAERDRAIKSLSSRGFQVSATRQVSAGDKIVERASRFIGVHEEPPGSNSGPLITKWLKRVGYPYAGPWCAAFASCMAEDAGYPLKGGGSASVAVLEARAKNHRKWTHTPRRGYLGVLPHGAHIVVVARVTSKGIHTIEGNTSASNGTNYNGGEVARHIRPASDFVGFIKTF